MENLSKLQMKKRLTLEEKMVKLSKYEKYVSPYPKGQLCTFYLRGLCWFETCQFAHGVDDLNKVEFMRFCNDKRDKKVSNNDIVRNIQKTHLIIKREYKILHNFLEENKHNLSVYYTFKQLSEDLKKRIEIRKIFHQFEFEKFSRWILTENKTLTIDQYEFYVDALGFSYSFKYANVKFLLSKTLIDKTTHKKSSLIKLMPKTEDIMSNFIATLIRKFEEDLQKNTPLIFPISFKLINNILNKSLGFEDPLIHHYMKLRNITSSEFLEELVNNVTFYSELIKLGEKYKFVVPQKEDLIYVHNLTEIVNEIQETFWEKYFNTLNLDIQIGMMPFTFLSDHYVKKVVENVHSTVNEATFTQILKKNLIAKKNLVIKNNNYNHSILNLQQFKFNHLSEYFETNYEKRCDIEDPQITNLLNEFFDEGNEKDLSSLLEELDLSNVKEVDQEVNLVEDISSYYTFFKYAKEFKLVSIDLEGSLCSDNCVVELIQIFDSKSGKTFVIDIFKIKDDTLLFKKVKEILTYVLQNDQITKVFHDGRKDCLALHQYFSICPSNCIDTSCLYSAVKQIKLQMEFHNSFLKKVKTEELINVSFLDGEFSSLNSNLYGSVNPGLNKVLEAYEPEGRINHLKEKFHSIFNNDEERNKLFCSRPLSEDFLLYSVLDVKYLIGAYHGLMKELHLLLKTFYGDNMANHNTIELVARLVSNDHFKMNCIYDKI